MADRFEDTLSIHREDDGEEYLVIGIGEKWWEFVAEHHTLAIPLREIEEARQERRNVDALLASIE